MEDILSYIYFIFTESYTKIIMVFLGPLLGESGKGAKSLQRVVSGQPRGGMIKTLP